MNLKQPEFTYTACGPFTKNKEIKKQQKILKKQETQDIFNKMNQDLVDMQLISKYLDFYCVLLTFIVNTHGLLL